MSSYTKYHLNVTNHEKKSGNMIVTDRQTDGRMDRQKKCKPVVPFSKTGKGLKRKKKY